MRLTRIRLVDFRNYAKQELEFPPGIIVLSGPNGSGKSNLLEAIHYLSYLKSFRPSRDREVIRFGRPLAAVEASLVDDAGRPFDAQLVLRGGQRHLKFNGDNITRFQDYIGRLHSQFFFPGDLALITGDPSLRREMIDLELLRLKPQLVPLYAGFRNALSQRNRTLKLIYPRPGEARAGSDGLRNTLNVYTDQLIETGAKVVLERLGLTVVLDKLFEPLYSSLAPPAGERVTLKYNSIIPCDDRDGIAAQYRILLDIAAENEAQLRYTTAGPHRDDLGFILNGERDLRRFGSQGQMRSAALSFKLALCALSARRLSDDPILLLDDALSEMDDERKQRLLSICRKRSQVFITSASKREVELIEPLANAVYSVDNGVVTRQD